jgi:hypothetical protein
VSEFLTFGRATRRSCLLGRSSYTLARHFLTGEWASGRSDVSVYAALVRARRAYVPLRTRSFVLMSMAVVTLVSAMALLAWDFARFYPPDLTLGSPVTRASLRIAAFGTTSLPRTLPTVQRDWRDDRFPYARRIDRLTVHMSDGFTSVAYDLWPSKWKGRSLIYHNGHAEDLDARPRVLRWFLKRGWRVVDMTMPLAGQNQAPGFARIGTHNEFARLRRPLEPFLNPVVAILNYSHADVMIGLSGGGWTTVAAAAIDPRIRRSYSVAGSEPLPWRCLAGKPGCAPSEEDLEQRMIPDYIRLYELGSSGGQRQVALYDMYDWCCFSGTTSRIWSRLVRGNFEAVIDHSSRQHTVTRFHLRFITDDLERGNARGDE